MNVLYYYAIGFAVIWIAAILFRDKLKIDVNFPILMRKTKRLRGFIDNTAQRSPRFWKVTMNVGIPITVFFMILIVYLVLISLKTLLSAPQVSLILPGVSVPGSPIFIPFAYGIIALMTVMVIHEFGHGIIARAEGIKIDSIGVLLLAILPGAFVEPNEEDIEKSKRITKLRIYAAGSFFNLILAALSFIGFVLITVLILGSLTLSIPAITIPGTSIGTEPVTFLNATNPVYPVFSTEGIQIESVVPGSPGSKVLQTGMVLQSINGVSTNNITKFTQLASNLHIGENLTLKTNQGTYHIIAGTNPTNSTRGYIGISSTANEIVNPNYARTYGQLPWLAYDLSILFYWIFLLNFAVGTFNLLPMKPLDGGLMLEELLRYKLSNIWVNRIMTPVSYILIMIIVVSIGYSLIRGLMMAF